MPNLLELLCETGGRRAVKIVHHIQGRIRLRATSELRPLLAGQNSKELLATLAAMSGIDNVNVNPLTASLVVQYDPKQIPFRAWEDLFQGNDEIAKNALLSIMQSRS
ncbi:MAG: cation transporter [Magnetococcales bacterium]|nr:cation transporter [Magnetococcales bacterium]